MLKEYWHCGRAIWQFRGYDPQPITRKTFLRWLRQYPEADRPHLMALLEHVKFINRNEMRSILFDLNRQLMRRLEVDGISANRLLYLQVHDAGSSSPVVLNMLRDAAHLQRRGCHLIDASNAKAIYDTTNQLEYGAIIYVDDFLGTASQFEPVREFLARYIVGNFPEFVLAPAMTEEAILRLGRLGVEPVCRFVHGKADRPLNDASAIFQDDVRSRLVELCFDIDAMHGLGFGSIATMIIFYSGAPDTVPRILRGSSGQDPRCGIFPRHSDMPLPI
jgi:hypothetical protein